MKRLADDQCFGLVSVVQAVAYELHYVIHVHNYHVTVDNRNPGQMLDHLYANGHSIDDVATAIPIDLLNDIDVVASILVRKYHV